MRDFKSGRRSGFSSDRSGSPSRRFGSPSGSRSSGRRGGFNDREGARKGGGFERRKPEMHEVTCSKCKKRCEVPFEPTRDKPVYCSDCFKTEGGSRANFRESSSSSGISQDQFRELSTKLDKILEILEQIEFEPVEDDSEGDIEDENSN
jgi:CxxC-x17-CxxC domain-containing protein